MKRSRGVVARPDAIPASLVRIDAEITPLLLLIMVTPLILEEEEEEHLDHSGLQMLRVKPTLKRKLVKWLR